LQTKTRKRPQITFVFGHHFRYDGTLTWSTFQCGKLLRCLRINATSIKSEDLLYLPRSLQRLGYAVKGTHGMSYLPARPINAFKYRTIGIIQSYRKKHGTFSRILYVTCKLMVYGTKPDQIPVTSILLEHLVCKMHPLAHLDLNKSNLFSVVHL